MPLPANDLPPGAPAYARGPLANPSSVPQQSWLDRVIAIFHSAPQQEHPLASTDRLLGRADQLEAQLDDLQRRSSPNGNR